MPFTCSTTKLTIPEMRAKIVAFLKGKRHVERGTIKEHLGLEPYACNGILDAALKSRKIAVIKATPQIGKWPDGSPLYGATPISLYSDPSIL